MAAELAELTRSLSSEPPEQNPYSYIRTFVGDPQGLRTISTDLVKIEARTFTPIGSTPGFAEVRVFSTLLDIPEPLETHIIFESDSSAAGAHNIATRIREAMKENR